MINTTKCWLHVKRTDNHGAGWVRCGIKSRTPPTAIIYNSQGYIELSSLSLHCGCMILCARRTACKLYSDGLPQVLGVEGHLHPPIWIKLGQLFSLFKHCESTASLASLRRRRGASHEKKNVLVRRICACVALFFFLCFSFACNISAHFSAHVSSNVF